MTHEIVIGVTGGIAAYKSAALVSQLVQAGHGVTVVMTGAARKFVGSATFAALTGRPVETRTFAGRSRPLGAHIELARTSGLLCVAPASADFLAKAAHGIADDLLTTLALSFTGHLMAAPAMNNEMWEKPAVQRNIQQLQDDGWKMIGPNAGWLSCREVGPGRMAEPEEIAAAIEGTLG